MREPLAARPLQRGGIGRGHRGHCWRVARDKALDSRVQRILVLEVLAVVGLRALLLDLDRGHHRARQPPKERLGLGLGLPARDRRHAIVAKLLSHGPLKLRAAAIPPAVSPAILIRRRARHGRRPRLRLPQCAAHDGEDILEEEVDREALRAGEW